MKFFIVFVATLVLAAAAPQYGHGGHGHGHEVVEYHGNNGHDDDNGGHDGGNDGGHGGNDGGHGGGNGGGNGGGGGGGNDGGHGHGHGHATSYVQVDHHDKHPHAIHFKAHPEYHYGFNVHDDKHHVYTKKNEERDGYKVKGSYSLVQPDGKTRIVEYTSDKKRGFEAKVTYKHHH